jgi:hypothetical protein
VGRPAEGRAGMPWDAAFDDHLILAYPLPFRMRRARGYVSKMSASDINAGSASLRSLQRRRSPLSLQRFFFWPVEAHGRESSKSSWPNTRAAPNQSRRLCLGGPGGEMSVDALLATPARPLYERSHRLQKKVRPKSLSFCSDKTVTDDQQAAPIHSGPPFFGFRAYGRCDRSD